ncbi:MAG: hypothetical protein ABSD82_06125 [Solirubrobacteraceae bacterium]|jgi:hypothetical protein
MSVFTPARAGTAAALAAVALAVGGCGATHAPAPRTASCLRQPHSFAPYVLSGSTLAVRVGVLVYAVEGEPEEFMTRPNPTVFPWLPPASSAPAVLGSVRLCRTYVSGFGGPEQVFAFRAKRPGRAVLSASLELAWRSVRHAPEPFAATVTVRR